MLSDVRGVYDRSTSAPDCSASAPESKAALCGWFPQALSGCRSLAGLELSHVGLRYRHAGLSRRRVVREHHVQASLLGDLSREGSEAVRNQGEIRLCHDFRSNAALSECCSQRLVSRLIISSRTPSPTGANNYLCLPFYISLSIGNYYIIISF